jgi:ABC-type polar amino acid transport system ATPase subunit
MPSFNHVVKTEYQPTFRTEKIVGMFDVPMATEMVKEWSVNLPIEDKPWSVGLIVGASGSGKTTIAKRAFENELFFEGHEWGKDAFVNSFASDLDIKSITDALSHVGFASPPSWLLPYHCLSNGQKFRADLARAILETEGILVFDEFTSLVDRTVAQIGSFAVQKFVRKMKRQFVAVTCHYDVAEWLEPDWVFDVSTMEFSRRLLRRPTVEVEIQRVHHSIWRIFKGHHYLSADIHKASRIYLATINGEPAAMTAVMAFPHKCKNLWREHRTVVLPDFQGFGLGNRLSEHVGDLLISQGQRYTSVTSHPAMIHYRAKSKKWIMSRPPSRITRNKQDAIGKVANSSSRITASFQYVGDSNGTK